MVGEERYGGTKYWFISLLITTLITYNLLTIYLKFDFYFLYETKYVYCHSKKYKLQK